MIRIALSGILKDDSDTQYHQNSQVLRRDHQTHY